MQCRSLCVPPPTANSSFGKVYLEHVSLPGGYPSLKQFWILEVPSPSAALHWPWDAGFPLDCYPCFLCNIGGVAGSSVPPVLVAVKHTLTVCMASCWCVWHHAGGKTGSFLCAPLERWLPTRAGKPVGHGEGVGVGWNWVEGAKLGGEGEECRAGKSKEGERPVAMACT